MNKDLLLNDELYYLIEENNKSIEIIEESTNKEVVDYLWLFYAQSGKGLNYAIQRYEDIANDIVDYGLKFEDFWISFENKCFNVLVNYSIDAEEELNIDIKVKHRSNLINIHSFKDEFTVNTKDDYEAAVKEIKSGSYYINDMNGNTLKSLSYSDLSQSIEEENSIDRNIMKI